jgi:hypothetical protein
VWAEVKRSLANLAACTLQKLEALIRNFPAGCDSASWSRAVT